MKKGNGNNAQRQTINTGFVIIYDVCKPIKRGLQASITWPIVKFEFIIMMRPALNDDVCDYYTFSR